jgi:hypothetical protein
MRCGGGSALGLARDEELVLGELREVAGEEVAQKVGIGLGDESVVPCAARVAVAAGASLAVAPRGSLAAVAVGEADRWRVVDGDL